MERPRWEGIHERGLRDVQPQYDGQGRLHRSSKDGLRHLAVVWDFDPAQPRIDPLQSDRWLYGPTEDHDRAAAELAARGNPWNLPFNLKIGTTSGSFDNAGVKTQAGLDISQQTAVASASVYYHRYGAWSEPPNLFNPYWHATLVSGVINGSAAGGGDPKRGGTDYGTAVKSSAFATSMYNEFGAGGVQGMAMRGQATVEAAIAMVVFVAMLLGGLHFGELAIQSIKVSQAQATAMWDATGYPTANFAPPNTNANYFAPRNTAIGSISKTVALRTCCPSRALPWPWPAFRTQAWAFSALAQSSRRSSAATVRWECRLGLSAVLSGWRDLQRLRLRTREKWGGSCANAQTWMALGDWGLTVGMEGAECGVSTAAAPAPIKRFSP